MQPGQHGPGSVTLTSHSMHKQEQSNVRSLAVLMDQCKNDTLSYQLCICTARCSCSIPQRHALQSEHQETLPLFQQALAGIPVILV